jgi:hypothetical protein
LRGAFIPKNLSSKKAVEIHHEKVYNILNYSQERATTCPNNTVKLTGSNTKAK